MADFYAGYAEHSVGVKVIDELRDCMLRDDEVTYTWDQALKAMWKQERTEWIDLKDKAFGMSEPLFAECLENGKIQVVMPEIDAWWTGFYESNDALTELKDNFERNKLRIKANAVLMHVQWQLGFYYAAGKSFGRFDRLLMGPPKWTANKAENKVEPVEEKTRGTGQDYVTFSTGGLDAWFGTDLKKNA